MTVTIDLLPPEDAAAARAARRVRRAGGIAGGLVAAALVLGHGAVEAGLVRAARELAAMREQRVAVERPLAALRRLRRREAALARRLRVIRRLEAREPVARRVLDALPGAAPPGLWLTGLALSGERVRLAGFAAADRLIARFVARLRDSAGLPSLDLEEAGADAPEAPGPRRFVLAGGTTEEP